MSIQITLKTFEAFRSGDNIVFKDIVRNCYPKVFGFIRKMIKSDWDAEELTQDVFVKLWEKHEIVKSPESFNAFLFTIARNLTFNYMEKKTPEIVELDDNSIINEFYPDVSSLLEAEELDLIISMTVEQMPPQRKKVFEMSRKEGLSLDEIANKLDISKNTVLSHLGVALDQVRKAIVLFVHLMLWNKFH